MAHYIHTDLAFCTDDIDGQINREVREQLGGSDHRPVLLTMNTYISCESTLPRWNYKKADWTLYSQLTDQVTKDIRVDGRDINKVVNDFNAGILSEELDRLDEESSAARRECETNPSQDNHSHLQHTKARFLRYKLQEEKLEIQNSITHPGER